MPLNQIITVLGGVTIEQVAELFGVRDGRHIGFVVLLVTDPDRMPPGESGVDVKTDIPDPEEVAYVLQHTAEVLRGER